MPDRVVGRHPLEPLWGGEHPDSAVRGAERGHARPGRRLECPVPPDLAHEDRAVVITVVPDSEGASLEMARGGFAAMHSLIAAELATRYQRQGRLSDAVRLADEGIDQARRTTAGEILGSALTTRAELAITAADHAEATELLDEAVAVARIIGHQPLLTRIAAARQALADGVVAPEPAADTANDGLIEPLSEREVSVLRLLRGDLTQREIGDELYIAASTVKSHIKSIYRKLGVSKRSHAITRAGELGFFD